MRIAHYIRALIVVLGFAAVIQPVFSNKYFNETTEFPHSKITSRKRNHQERSRMEAYRGQEECCPTKEELIEPNGGRNQDGLLVTLYMDSNHKQRFYEISCKDDVLNKPCKFVPKRLSSMCVQKYSYTYALVSVKDSPSHRNSPTLPGQNYVLDYIRIKSGCSCSVTKHRKKKKRPHESNHRAD